MELSCKHPHPGIGKNRRVTSILQLQRTASVEIAAGSVSIGKQLSKPARNNHRHHERRRRKEHCNRSILQLPGTGTSHSCFHRLHWHTGLLQLPEAGKHPYTAKTIGAYAFANCSTLTDVTFAEGIDSIADYAFVNSTNINRWHCRTVCAQSAPMHSVPKIKRTH